MRVIALLICSLFFSVPVVTAQEKAMVIQGQIACAECWTEADRKTTPYGSAHDMKCAVTCHNDGIGSILAVKTNDEFTLYQLEFGKLKKTKRGWLDYTAKQVEISGTVREKDGKQYLKVNSLKVLQPQPASESKPVTANVVGTQSPDLQLKDLTGSSQNLRGYRGKIVVLNFWATWCAPCKQEMPIFVKAQNTYAAFGVQVVAASADELSKRDAVIKFVREAGLNFPIWLGTTTEAMAQFGVGPGIPATIVMDREGKIAAVFQSVVTEAELTRQIDALLAAQSASQKSELPTEPVDSTEHEGHEENAKSSSVPS